MIRGQTMMEVASYAVGQAVADLQCIPTGTGDIVPLISTTIIIVVTLAA